MPIRRLTMGVHLAVGFLGLLLSNEVLAQNVVPPGEQRLNRFQFKTTHNSYERDGGVTARVSITDQLDRFDVWMVEFDLRWHRDNNDFYVFHHCAEAGGNDTLNFFLDQIKASNRSRTGITFIYFDTGDIGPCLLFPNIVPKPSSWKSLLEARLKSYFGSAVYDNDYFQRSGLGDRYQWPSPQELLRRGKHIIPIIHGPDDRYFFTVGQLFSINTDDANATIPALGDDKFSRWYATGWICGPDTSSWETAVGNNFSFPADNCAGLTNPRFHPPLPTYVGAPTASDSGRGTWLEPLRGPNGFKTAIGRVTEHQGIKGASPIEIRINAGTHTAPPRIAASVRLTSSGGNIRLAR